MMLSMLPLRPALVIISLVTLLFTAVQYLSRDYINPAAVALHLQPLFLAALLCIPLSLLSKKLKEI